MDTMITLEQLLDSLCRGQGLHICIHDISGILQKQYLKLSRKYTLHSSNFCDAAKSTAKGHTICMRCKMITNEKASRTASWFQGYCCYGIYKVVYPVIINDRVVCIIYLGNLVDDPEKLRTRICKMCHITGVQPETLFSQLDTLENVRDGAIYYNIAKIIACHIQQLDSVKNDEPTEQKHWAVEAVKQYAESAYTQDVLLKDIAKLYYVNHQYIGRLFKEQTGISFRQYVNDLRLQKAEQELLTHAKKSIMDIAMDCGFQTVTYFNRVFRERFHMSPHEYRKVKS